MMILPTSMLPVNAILSTSGWATIGGARRLAEAGDDVDDALGQPARPRRSVANSRSVSGVCSAGLITIVQPAQMRGGELPGRHEQRVVPGDDLPGHAQRLAQGQRDRVVGHVQHLAVELGGEAAVVLEAGGDVARGRTPTPRWACRSSASRARPAAGSSSRIFSARRKRMRPRSWAVTSRQPPSKARRAAWTAWSTSAAPASGTFAMTSSGGGVHDVEGLAATAPSTHSPSISIR